MKSGKASFDKAMPLFLKLPISVKLYAVFRICQTRNIIKNI